MLFRANAASTTGKLPAQHALMERYGGAVFRYLLGAVRDPDAAAELTQEFVVRFLRGDFHRANPDQGRFRDYLRTALINLAREYRRTMQRLPGPLNPDTPAPERPEPPDDDEMFLASWRAELLIRTWDALASAHPTQHATLRARVAEPELPSHEIAQRVTTALGRTVTAAAVRKALQRAHENFAELLVQEVADSLGEPSPNDLMAELRALDLLRYCRSAIENRNQRMESEDMPPGG